MSDATADDSSADGHTGVPRTKKHAPESGAFGKSTRRSRSKTGTPAKREDPTILAADAIFSKYLAEMSSGPSESLQRKPSLPSSVSQPNLSSQTAPIDLNANNSHSYVQNVPTEIILRGYKSTHQYAAIKQYESIAGRICEDYPRDPPIEQRRYKSDLRDPASLRTRPLTAEEKAKAMRFAGGENWIKVTFESAEAAEAAIYSSPQTILGYLVFAEPYRGVPPTIEEAIPAVANQPPSGRDRFQAQTIGPASSSFSSRGDRRPSSNLPRSFTTPSMTQIGRGQQQQLSLSPPGSNTSSSTLDTATLSTATTSSATVTSFSPPTSRIDPASQAQEQDPESIYCRRIPTAKRMQLLPADQALLPQPSYSQRILAQIPLLSFFSANIIGTEIPRTENGEFDWVLASLYWKIWWWLDFWFGLCGGDVAGSSEKEE
jgi:hypothetical protein